MFEKILVAVDGSKYAEKALRFAVNLAQDHDAELGVVTIYEQNYAPTVAGEGMVAHVSTAAEEEREAAEKIAAAATATAGNAGVANTKSIVTRGDPASQILAAAKAEKADLIVLGSHGHGTLAGLLLGSVSHKVMSHAKCTCVVVR